MNYCNLSNVKHIHLVGIGGAGMGGIAEVLLNQGYQISGSDMARNNVTERLQRLGARIHLGHQANHVQGADVVVVSTAIHSDNPEVVTASQNRIPVIQRAQMLAELMSSYSGIAVAGTHGKTTTTSLIASILAEGGLDPTFVIGGLLKSAGTHAKLGGSRYFVAEADESDASFLYLHPQIAVVTNIDNDHLETYHGDFERLKETFLQFLHHLPFNGLAVVCIDDPVVREILPLINKPVLTYGFSEDADIRALNYRQDGLISYFTIRNQHGVETAVMLNLTGRHNALNALAAYGVAKVLEVEDGTIARALAQFAGVGRRFQLLGELPVKGGSALVVEDYGHHPREVAAVIDAARAAWPDRRLVMAYQPHRYTRTRDLWQDFINVLKQVDQLILLDIYSAGEAPIKDITGRLLHQAIQSASRVAPLFVEQIAELPQLLSNVLLPNDVVFLQGAGSIGSVGNKILTAELKAVVGG